MHDTSSTICKRVILDAVGMATVYVGASINRLHNTPKLLTAIYEYTNKDAGKEGGRGGGAITVNRAREGKKNTRGGHK